MKTENSKKRLEGPRWKVTIRVTRDTQVRVKAAAAKWGVAPTEAVTKLLQIGLDAEAGTLDPDGELMALGFTLAAIADRLDRLDKLAEVTARGAIKSGMAAVHQLKVSGSAPEVLKRLEDAVQKALEEARK